MQSEWFECKVRYDKTLENGLIKKTAMNEYDSSRKSGIIGINLKEGDELISVKLTDGRQNIIMGTKLGYAITFNEEDARPIGRVSSGVKGIKITDGDELVGMDIAEPGRHILTVTENGYGKLTKTSMYPVQNRAGKGVQNYKLSSKTGRVIGLITIDRKENDVMMISDDGVVIRMEASGISTMGRSTSGVKVMTMKNELARVSAIAKVPHEEEPPEQQTMDAALLQPEENKTE